MKDKFINILKNYYPIFGLLLIAITLAITNYVPGAYLTGWDNLHPEFDFSMNIKRSIFAVWQEYQSLGLLGGMGHASDLFRQIFLLFASIFIPDSLLRYFWTFLTLFIGASGTYVLIDYILKKINRENKLVAFTGAIFYLLNISTIQVFFIPFEAFIAHYAFLPWVILASLYFIQKPSIKRALITFIIFLITPPQAYIPTLFVSTILAVSITSLPFFYKNFRKTLIAYLELLLLIFLANSYWLLPFIFFTVTNSSVNLDSKINQMATEIIFLQNKEFGDIANVPLLRGYLFSNVEPNELGKFDYILGVWKEFFKSPHVLIGSYFMFGVILLGMIKALLSRNRLSISFVLLFIFGFTMLATNIPPFSFINNIFRENIPLFNQAFRFPYTKFLTVASLSYAVLLSFGVLEIIDLIKNVKVKKIIPVLFILLIFIISLPAFTGKFFYFKERLKIPQEYFQTFDYFKTQNPNTRIANFPQYTFWGWNFYNWGYSGSGFIWYGIEQPILDRAFDVWSKESENYYWEINHAVYSKNPKKLEEVLNKYDVNYILIDKNVANPVSPKSLFNNELKELITQIPTIKKAKEYGNIEIYNVELKNKPTNFISSLSKISNSNSYSWSDYDQAYSSLGDYSSGNAYSNYFPYRTIFESKTQKENNYSINKASNIIEYETLLPESKTPVNLNIPSPVNTNNTIPVNIFAKKSNGIITIYLKITNPEIFLKINNKEKKLWENTVQKELFKINEDYKNIVVNINGVTNFNIEELKENKEKLIGSTTLTLGQNNILVLNSGNNTLDFANIAGSTLKEWFVFNGAYISIPKIDAKTSLVLKFPKLNDKYLSQSIDPTDEIKKKKSEVTNCDNFRKEYFSYFIKVDDQKKLLELISKNATPCVAFYLPTLDHDQAYLISVENKNISDQSLHFWVYNEDGKQPIVDKYLDKNKNLHTSYITLPPMEKYGKSYSIHFDNASLGTGKSGNQLGKITVDPIPYYFITNIEIEDPNNMPLEFTKADLNVKHPNQSLYLVEIKNPTDAYAFSLSQSYSKYWKAYKVNGFNILEKSLPFILGSEIKNKSMLNNWKNSWIVENPNTSRIIIIYLPQYLEYLGFVLVSLSLIILTSLYLKSKRTTQKGN